MASEYQESGWREVMTHQCLSSAALSCSNVGLYFNYTGNPLAETDCGTLKLVMDTNGLMIDARVKTIDAPYLSSGVYYLGFSIRVHDQQWENTPDDDGVVRNPLRCIKELEIMRFSLVAENDAIAWSGVN